MSLQSRLLDLINAIGADIKALYTANFALNDGGEKTDAFTAEPFHFYRINFAASLGNKVIQLPTAPPQGTQIAFARVDTNPFSSYPQVTPGSGDTMAAGISNPYIVAARGGVVIVGYYGTAWYIVSHGFNTSGLLSPSDSNQFGTNLVYRNGSKQFEVGTPTTANHAVNKTYADLVAVAVPVTFSAAGVMTIRTGKSKIPMKGTGTIVEVKAYLDTAPTGATTFKVDVNKNGTTIYGTQANRPTWTASANAATVGAHSVTTYADGDVLSVDIDAVGSTVAGSDLTVVIYVLRTA